MTRHETFPLRLATERPVSIAIQAMGGQGGGVLADWIVALAEGEGWHAQSTSVPGVAQRTGATVYYIEMLPARGGTAPILALMPTPGDVDVVIAAEWMEAGRSILRGLVTPDRTTLIASTHRSYAVAEKETPGDGIADPAVVGEAVGVTAKRTVAFDMRALAEENGAAISAVLFGALSGAGVLPFAREAFEAAIRAGGKGVEPSLKAFAAAFERAVSPPQALASPPTTVPPVLPASAGHPRLDGLLDRIRSEFPVAPQAMLYAGAARLTDYQDPAYSHEYLDRVGFWLALDREAGGEAKDFALTVAAAKYVAVAMAYDDVIRVADLKTRASRFARVRREAGVRDAYVLHTTEFMRPRMEEVAGTLPEALGRWIEARPRLVRVLDRVVNRGRRVRTDAVVPFLTLHAVAGLRATRRRTLRHAREMAHMARWLELAAETAPRDYDLAVEIIACRRLVKGYSDTHSRGRSKFDRVLGALPLLAGRADAADWLRRLRQAALLDEEGRALDGALRTVESL